MHELQQAQINIKAFVVFSGIMHEKYEPLTKMYKKKFFHECRTLQFIIVYYL